LCVLRHRATNELPEYSNGVFSRIEEALAFSPQIAVIASPAPFHISTAQLLAENGVHLLVEKPLSVSLSGVSQLIETCKTRGLVLSTGYNLRFLPSLQRYRSLLSEGIVGRILSVRCEIGQYLPSWRPDCNYRECVSARRELGGGALLELSHELDYLRWVFGDVVWVKATLARQSLLEIDVEDSVHLTLGFASSEGRTQLIGTVNLDFIRHDTTRTCTAIGENGSLRWNGLTGEISQYKAGEHRWHEVFIQSHQRDDSYIAEWKDFIESVISEKRPLVDGKDGLIVLQIIEAARNSAATGGLMCEVNRCI
jgi:predicted dehydrogenase